MFAVQYNTVQYIRVQYNIHSAAVQCSTVQYSTVQYSMAQASSEGWIPAHLSLTPAFLSLVVLFLCHGASSDPPTIIICCTLSLVSSNIRTLISEIYTTTVTNFRETNILWDNPVLAASLSQLALRLM